jgi:GNAT superfamily N-acetyltransferase
MRSDRSYAVFVAEVPGPRIAGWVSVYMFRAVETDRCAEVSGIVVDEELRSRGIGELLLRAAENWARKQGCDEIWVRSNVKRTRAHAFYQRNGFGLVKTQGVFRKTLSRR